MKSYITVLVLLCACAASADTFTVTAYDNPGPNGCSICCGKHAPFNLTASGRRPVAGVTCAAPKRIPFGTWVYIEGVGKRRVEDRLARRFPDRWEIFVSTHKTAKIFGKQRLDITILKP
jgi:3D (Asp-Asp-Asp) domain-containing protein